MLNEESIRILKQMRLWQQKFNVSGDGVTFKNTEQTCSVLIQSRPAPAASNDNLVIVKITTALTGAGLYNGRSVTGSPTAVDPATALSLPQTGETVSGTDDVLIENLAENGATTHYIASGTFAIGMRDGFSNESPPREVVRVWATPPGLIPVTCSQIGGLDGSVPSTPASWTYNITDLQANALASGVAVVGARMFNAPTVKATRGMAYYSGGAWHLMWVDESFTNMACP